MTEIEPMPCSGVIAVETPGYRPCEDCRGLRHLCGMPQCEKTPSTKRTRPRYPNDPDDPRPDKRVDNGAYQRWLRRQKVKAGTTPPPRPRGRPLSVKTVEAIPEVDPVPETPTEAQERAESVAFLDEGPVDETGEILEEMKAAILEAQAQAEGAYLRIENLLCDIIDELRRPRTLRLTVCGGGLFLEEVAP
jgi:hypothetical protein